MGKLLPHHVKWWAWTRARDKKLALSSRSKCVHGGQAGPTDGRLAPRFWKSPNKGGKDGEGAARSIARQWFQIRISWATQVVLAFKIKQKFKKKLLRICVKNKNGREGGIKEVVSSPAHLFVWLISCIIHLSGKGRPCLCSVLEVASERVAQGPRACEKDETDKDRKKEEIKGMRGFTHGHAQMPLFSGQSLLRLVIVNVWKKRKTEDCQGGCYLAVDPDEIISTITSGSVGSCLLKTCRNGMDGAQEHISFRIHLFLSWLKNLSKVFVPRIQSFVNN